MATKGKSKAKPMRTMSDLKPTRRPEIQSAKVPVNQKAEKPESSDTGDVSKRRSDSPTVRPSSNQDTAQPVSKIAPAVTSEPKPFDLSAGQAGSAQGKPAKVKTPSTGRLRRLLMNLLMFVIIAGLIAGITFLALKYYGH